MAGGILAVDICRHNPMTYDFYTQCTCGQDGSNILDSVAELYKMQIDPMFLNILCSSFGEGCKNKAPTKKKKSGPTFGWTNVAAMVTFAK